VRDSNLVFDLIFKVMLYGVAMFGIDKIPHLSMYFLILQFNPLDLGVKYLLAF
jgi:hypothetical protein